MAEMLAAPLAVAVPTTPSYFTSSYEENLFTSRYKWEEEANWEAVFSRVANAVTQDPDKRRKYKSYMSNGCFLPSSPQLWNFGTNKPYNRAGSSCYTLGIEDNLDSFEQNATDARKIFVASGGAGWLFDNCRPRGVAIAHSVSACVGLMGFGGPLRRLEAMTGYITNGGRERGAMMAQLSVEHPDAIEFICAKRPVWIGRGEPTHSQPWNYKLELQNCNMSIRLSDCFMRAVEQNLPWVFSWYGDDGKGHLGTSVDGQPTHEARRIHYHPNGTISHSPGTNGSSYKRGSILTTWEGVKKTLAPNPRNFKDVDHAFLYRTSLLPAISRHSGPLMARQIFDLICRCTWESGDPGVVFDNTTERWNPTPKYGKRHSNPCLLGYTLVDTADGCIPIEKLAQMSAAGEKLPMVFSWGADGLPCLVQPTRAWKTKEVNHFVRVKTGKGVVVDCTSEHKFLTVQGGWITAGELSLYTHIQDIEHFNNDKYTGGDAVWSVDIIVPDKLVAVYDLSVPETECFAVTNEGGNRRRTLIVHNCAEFLDPKGGSCLLISQNLRAAAEKANGHIPTFLKVVERWATKATQYINDALNHCVAPVKYIEEMTRTVYRNVGQGVMGLAEALMICGRDYGDESGTSLASQIMESIALASWETSFTLHAQDSVTYRKPLGWDPERMYSIFKMRGDLPISTQRARWQALADRVAGGECATNVTVTAIAPTGSISMICGWQMSRLVGKPKQVSSGCEPPFDRAVGRQDNSGNTVIYHDLARHPLFRAAGELSPNQHVSMQAALTQFTCMGVSKTVNLPNSATPADIANAYFQAWQQGVPATAVYRDGSKPFAVLTGLVECPSGECEVHLGGK